MCKNKIEFITHNTLYFYSFDVEYQSWIEYYLFYPNDKKLSYLQ